MLRGLTAILLATLVFGAAHVSSAQILGVQLVDGNGQAVEVRDERPTKPPTTLAEFSRGVRQDPLKRYAALTLAATLAGLILCCFLPSWSLLSIVKKLGLVFSFIGVLAAAAVLFKVNTDLAFYDRIYAVWRTYRPQRVPKTEAGRMIWVKGGADRQFLRVEKEGLKFPKIERFTLHKVSEISRIPTPISVTNGETLMTWKELERLRKKYEHRIEFTLDPKKRDVYKIDVKREAVLSDEAMRKVRDHAYQEKARLERLGRGTSGSTSFQHYYLDAEENIVGSLKDAKETQVKTGVWEDGTGFRQTYLVPYILVDRGDPPIAFWIFKDTGAEPTFDAYLAELPEEVRPYLGAISMWLVKNMFTELYFRKGVFPDDVLAQMTFVFSDKSEFHFAPQTWENWLVTLENQ